MLRARKCIVRSVIDVIIVVVFVVWMIRFDSVRVGLLPLVRKDVKRQSKREVTIRFAGFDAMILLFARCCAPMTPMAGAWREGNLHRIRKFHFLWICSKKTIQKQAKPAGGLGWRYGACLRSQWRFIERAGLLVRKKGLDWLGPASLFAFSSIRRAFDASTYMYLYGDGTNGSSSRHATQPQPPRQPLPRVLCRG